jgi:hypothetical protein
LHCIESLKQRKNAIANLTINVPAVYMARYVMVPMRGQDHVVWLGLMSHSKCVGFQHEESNIVHV